jgi:hypothetical protein
LIPNAKPIVSQMADFDGELSSLGVQAFSSEDIAQRILDDV